MLPSVLIGQDSSEQALIRVNQYRELAGLNTAGNNSLLAAAAEAHAQYLAIHNIMGHYESPGAKGFTGRTPWDRTKAKGYNYAGIYENVSYIGMPSGAVDSWIDSVYHRFPILMPGMTEAGYGKASNKDQSFDVMKYSVEPPGKGSIRYSLYPADSQYGVPIAFGGESPNPRPDRSELSGYPVTVTVQPWSSWEKILVKDFYIEQENGQRVDSWVIHPGNDNVLTTSAACIPKERLKRYHTYRVFLRFSVPGDKTYTERWSFTTGLRNTSSFFGRKLKDLREENRITYVKLTEAADFFDYIGNLLLPDLFFSGGTIPTLWKQAQSLGVGHPWQMRTRTSGADQIVTYTDKLDNLEYVYRTTSGKKKIFIEGTGISVTVTPDHAEAEIFGQHYSGDGLEDIIQNIDNRLSKF
ncbi:MAG: CAP domain-containing protein [Spirochaetia bacterium]